MTATNPAPAHIAIVEAFEYAARYASYMTHKPHADPGRNASNAAAISARDALYLALAQPVIAAPAPDLTQPKLHAMQHALRQIVDADDAHELTQQIIDIGRAALALPTLAAQPQVLSDAQIDATFVASNLPQSIGHWMTELREFARAIELAHGISATVAPALSPGGAT